MEVPVPIERVSYQKWATYMPSSLFEKVKETFEEHKTLDIVHWFKVSQTVEDHGGIKKIQLKKKV